MSMVYECTWYMKRLLESKKNHYFHAWNHEQKQEMIMNIWNLTPNLHTNSQFKKWAKKSTIMHVMASSCIDEWTYTIGMVISTQ